MTERPHFTRVTSRVVALDAANIDTDQILPARFLKLSRSDGLSQAAFHDQRFDDQGAARAGFSLNEPRYEGSQILAAGDNFGTGSSREAAVYALYDYGFRCVIAPSFASIFFANALRNGLLPVQLEAGAVARIRRQAQAPDGLVLTVDLEAGVVVMPSGESLSFTVPSLQRLSLLTGKDELEMTIEHEAEIRSFVAAYQAANPWVVPVAPTDEPTATAGDPAPGALAP